MLLFRMIKHRLQAKRDRLTLAWSMASGAFANRGLLFPMVKASFKKNPILSGVLCAVALVGSSFLLVEAFLCVCAVITIVQHPAMIGGTLGFLFQSLLCLILGVSVLVSVLMRVSLIITLPEFAANPPKKF
jgi:hypothetical protein